MVHVCANYATMHAWTLCGMRFEHNKMWSKQPTQCLTCIMVDAGVMNME